VTNSVSSISGKGFGRVSIIESHLDELDQLHKYTTEALSSALDSDRIWLYRSLPPKLASVTACARIHASASGIELINCYANIFNFHLIALGGSHNGGASIVREVMIKDILVCHQTLEGFDNIDQDVLL
jgi:hypothetical protein